MSIQSRIQGMLLPTMRCGISEYVSDVGVHISDGPYSLSFMIPRYDLGLSDAIFKKIYIDPQLSALAAAREEDSIG